MSKIRSFHWLLAPAVLFILVFGAIPLLISLVYSFMTANPYGGVQSPFTFAAYVQMLFDQDFDGSLVFMPDYFWIAFRSIYLAVATTVLSLAIGFPVAWYIVCQSPTRRKILLTLVSLPFWINTLIRTYCWILILRDEGLVNKFLGWLGAISHPLPLLYNQGSVLLGLVYTFLPFMVLPIYATLERLDPRLIEAAYDLYANRVQLFRRVIWPLTKPGIAAGTVLVFAPALGSFLQPDLLGGGKQLLIGSLIEMQFTSSRNWPFGAALSMLVTFAVVASLIWQSKRNKARAGAQA
ncbi:MAG TPA: ABC transporter permease [Acidisoma sp.]|jgi:spermidine/putrescine transport system permease protein|uniref:ABC transporter permease n=1 Tax=Acidisoma sp. TaxID=1872115 RepID=UPI002B8F2B9C|nr:ABC transporter permease [Acidisoma sp.]HTI01020.1 ABC transporter permease [Acidisoma sp.]